MFGLGLRRNSKATAPVVVAPRPMEISMEKACEQGLLTDYFKEEVYGWMHLPAGKTLEDMMAWHLEDMKLQEMSEFNVEETFEFWDVLQEMSEAVSKKTGQHTSVNIVSESLQLRIY